MSRLLSLSLVTLILILIIIYQKAHKRSVLPVFLTTLFGIIATIVYMVIIYFLPFGSFSKIYPGFTEELFRLICLVILLKTAKKSSLQTRIDYILYTMPFSIGFTILENFLWDYSSGIHVAFKRMLTPGHLAYGIILTYALYLYDRNREEKKTLKGILIVLLGFLIAFLIHETLDQPTFLFRIPLFQIPFLLTIFTKIPLLSLVWGSLLVLLAHIKDKKN